MGLFSENRTEECMGFVFNILQRPREHTTTS